MNIFEEKFVNTEIDRICDVCGEECDGQASTAHRIEKQDSNSSHLH
ncbi:hypothetical protein [Photobacterium angustum]|nr:hypothetical protein [Photobacterium angustum]